MPECPISSKIADSRSVRYTSPAHLARFLGCSQRKARELCKTKVIKEAEPTQGGHWRIRLPLSTQTRWILARLKYPRLFSGKVGVPNVPRNETWEKWLLLAELFGLRVITDEFDVVTAQGKARSDTRKINELKKVIFDAKERKPLTPHELDKLLLRGALTKLLRDRQKTTVTGLMRVLRMNSRKTFYRKFPPLLVKKERKKVLGTFRVDDSPIDKVGEDPAEAYHREV